MAFYTVMTPPPDGSDRREEIEQARLVPERFAWGAFLFTGLWLLGKRLWLATLLFVLVWGALIWLNSRFRLGTAGPRYRRRSSATWKPG